MSYNPSCIAAARNYVISRGLPAASLGVVGDPAHQKTGGYHLGNDGLSKLGRLNTDYSKKETDKDRPGSDAAMAFDVAYGNKPDPRLQAFSRWLVEQCKAGAPDTLNIREVIYSPDGTTVKRWDRLGVRSTGDISHRFHTHISYFRDSEGQDKTSLFRRYFEGTPNQEDEVELSDQLPFPGDKLVTGEVAPADTQTVAARLTYAHIHGWAARQIATAALNEIKALRAEMKTGTVQNVSVQVDATEVATALAANTDFLSAVAKAVADENARRQAE